MANFVAHFAIQADDIERARGFYQQAFGWRFEAWGPPGFFRVFTGEDEAGVTEGALYGRPQGDGPPATNAYRCSLSVADIEATRKAIADAGGTVDGPVFELPGVGKILNFTDPEGNAVAAVEYVKGDPRAVTPSP